MAEWLKLKKSNCKNCYKCIRHCPVKSIRFSGNQAHIVGNECILCGQCFVVCPQNAKEITDSVEKVRVLLQEEAPVIVSLAPSFIANYNEAGIEQMREAIKKLGFFDVEETAIGATIVKKQYEEILRTEQRNVLISSCCHSVNLLIAKYFPEALAYLADVVSPMVAHCMDIKRRYPNAKTVFIGPCVAKKDEAERSGGVVDAVLTFEELSRMFDDKEIKPVCEAEENENSRARFFPVTGGILKTMEKDTEKYTYITVDGVENCVAAICDILGGRIKNCFVEMSACVGSCISGPVMEKYHRMPVRDYIAVSNYAGRKDFEVDELPREQVRCEREPILLDKLMPSETELVGILRQMGKTKPEDELNCGSCGYNTCREKAIAIYQGKANISMCLPYLKDKAESFSDNIIKNTPNAIIVLNEDFEVQQINRAALKMMNLSRESDVLGEPVVRILDPAAFLQVKNSGRNIYAKNVYLAEYEKYAEQTVLFDKEYRIFICLMRDITEEEDERSRKEAISRQTVETADKVVEKQMRIVQEIASLLGETAAETKIALTKLKESISDE